MMSAQCKRWRLLGPAVVTLGLATASCSRVETEPKATAAPPPSEPTTPADPATAAATAPADAMVKVTLDSSTTFQTWEGAGASLQSWDEQARAQYRSEQWQRLFLEDMGMTVLRIDLMSNPLYTKVPDLDDPIRFGPDLEANVAMFDYDRDARAAIYGEVAAALVARGAPLRVLATVWSPPHEMKDGARLTHNDTNTSGGRLRMEPGNLEQYGRYMAAAVTAWERRSGVPIHALSIQNEPRFEQDYSSMALRPEEYAVALAAVDAELRRHKMSTLLFGPEDVGYGPEGDHSRLDQQLSFVRAIMAHPEAGPAIDAFAIHGYGGDGIDSRGYVAPGNWTYYRDGIKEHGKLSWQTESGGGPPHGLGPVYFANVIFEGLSYGGISLWCNWLFSKHGELDQHTLLGFDLNTDHPKYAVAKHYFRFIRPGARRLSLEPFDVDGVRLTAWQDADGGPLTVIAVNLRPEPAAVELQLGQTGEDRRLRRWQTSSEGNFVEQPTALVRGPLRVVLPPTSLTTLSDVVTE